MIEIISGTNRPENNTSKVVKALEEIYAEQGTSTQVIDLRDLPQELFLPQSYKEKPLEWQKYQERVLEADGLHVVIPEYNGSFPGVMKYFVDMLKFPESFQHRSVCYVGLSAGANGNLRGVEQLQLIFNYRNAFNLPERVWIPQVNQKLSEDGSRFADEAIIARLRDQVQNFLVYVKKHEGMAVNSIT